MDVHFTNNEKLLSALLGSPLGLFSLVDEECMFPQASDATLADKLNANLKQYTW